MTGFNIEKIRADFPVLAQKVHNKPLVYFDNGATTQKPLAVIDVVNRYHSELNSSIHRGVHFLSDQATNAYENARREVQHYINAKESHEIIFTSGTTGSINMLAFSFGERYIRPGDEIIITEMEHHANIVPWQMLCERKGSKLKVIPFNDLGILQIEKLSELITEKTKLISVTHISNTLGTINPIREIINIAHRHNVPVMIDAAQSIQHARIDVQELDVDFLVFSGHKVYGPTGIGVVYGKEKYLEELPPYQGGGDMVDEVTFEKTSYNVLPFKFEAGTTNYIGAIGLSAALQYIEDIGIAKIAAYETEVLNYGTQQMEELGYIRIYGRSPQKASILCFGIEGVHMADAGMIFDKLGVAVRIGSHCAQPVWQHFGMTGALRASIALYNTKEEIDYLCKAIRQVKTMLG
ncbi:MAG: SufS family cysteine desulfurase [Bacteroidales bacterium]|nr:SufS family cysteine desulfurase [Bacteroidales bacterium]